MKKMILLFAAFAAGNALAAIAPFRDNERVSFLGDSITAFNHYIANVQFAMDLRRGSKAPYFTNCGTAGDGVFGARQRIACDLMTARPERVIIMLGINDWAYDSWTTVEVTSEQRKRHEQRCEAFEKGLSALVDDIRAKGVRVDLMTPTPFDEYSTDLKRPTKPNCNEVAGTDFAAAVRRVAAARGLGLVELHAPMTALEKAHPTGLHYSGGDRVHPGTAGCQFMAAAILAAAGEIPASEVTPEGAARLFEKPAGSKAAALWKALEPVRTEAERIRGLVYCDRFVPGSGAKLDLADMSGACTVVEAWADRELAHEKESGRIGRLKKIRAEYRTTRTQVPAYQDALVKLHAEIVGKVCRSATAAGAPKPVFRGAINDAALMAFEKDPSITGWEVERRAGTSAPWCKAEVEPGTYPWNVGWSGRPILRVSLAGAAELRVRACRKEGPSAWTELGRMDPGRSAREFAVGGGYADEFGPDNLFDGRIDTLFEAVGQGGWCGQSFAAPVAIRAVRFIARFSFVTGDGTDRAEGAFVECADDDSFSSPRRIATIGKVREDVVNEIVFEKPVTARAFRVVKPHGAVLDLLELAFEPVGEFKPSTAPRGIVTVSPKGDDAMGDGSRAKPFKSLARAVAEVRRLPAPRTVEMMPGDYPIAKTVELGAQDAGLRIRALGGRVCLRGDRRLTDWKPDGDGLFAADVPEVRDGADSRTLFVNGAFAPRAELPGDGKRFKMRNDVGDLQMRSAMEGFWSRPPTDRETRSLEYDPKDLGPNFDARNAEIRVFHVWSESLCGVASNVVAENRLWFPKAIPPLGIWNRKDYIVYNTREGLTKPGQWYLDRTRGKVVYRPKPGENLAKLDIRLPLMQTLIRAVKVKNLAMEGLSFTGTTPPLMRAGFAGIELPGAVQFVGACPNARLDRLSFDHIGGTALRAAGSNGGRVSRCRFTDVGCVGAIADGIGLEFVSNVVQRFGVAYQSGCGVMAGGKGSHVWRNTVTDGPYCGFLVYSDSLYEENRVMRVMRELSDGAAFYGGIHDSVFRNNIVSDIHTIKGGYGGCGFYCDEGSQNNVYENNVAVDVGIPIHMHMGRGQIVRNNVFETEGNIELSFQGSRDCVFENNRVYYTGRYKVASPDAVSGWKNNVFFGPCGSQVEPPPEVPVQPVKTPSVKNVAPGYRFSLDRDAEGRIYGSSPMNGDLWWDDAGLHIRIQIVHMNTDPVKVGKAWGEGDGVRFTVNGRVFDRMAERQEKGRPHYNVAADIPWSEIGLTPKPGLEVPFNAQVRISVIDQYRWFESPSRKAVLLLRR